MLVLVALILSTTPPAPIKLAAPGLSAVNVTPELQTFVADHLNQQLVLAGISVLSATQVSAVLGLERQKQLLGCEGASDCVAEFANALGVDGLLLGNLAKFGTTLQLDVRVAAANDARNLATFSIRVADENGLLDAISKAAEAIATQLSSGMNRSLTPVVGRTETRWRTSRKIGMVTFFASTAIVVGSFIWLGVTPGKVEGQPAPPNYDTITTVGGVLVIAGLVGMLTGGLLWIFGGTEEVPVSAGLFPTREGLGFSFSGRF